MGLLSTSTLNKKGFTLIEIILVMTLLVMVLGFGLITGFDSYRRDALRAERNTVISVLQKARSQAINNVNNSKHGFYFDGTNYIVFEGTSSDSRISEKDLLIPKNSVITATGSVEIVFDQLMGNTVQTGDFILSDDTSSTTISINQEGRINW